MLPIDAVAARAGIPADALIPYGRSKAKIDRAFLDALDGRRDGKLILITAVSPTPAGEGKTTVAVGLADGMNRIGCNTLLALREPSLGPCFGMKGGAAGGGYAQVVPMEDINLHFTGDFHAIAAAHNLLAAMIDNHSHWSNELRIDLRRVSWRRIVDMNDRSLRHICVGIGGPANGPMAGGFDITAGLRGDGDFLPGARPGDLTPPRPHHHWLSPRPQAGVRAEVKAAGAMTVLLQRRAAAEPGADAREQSGADPRRAFRQHRARLQLPHRDAHALKLVGLCGHRSWFWRRPGRGEILRRHGAQRWPAPGAAVMVATVRALKMHGGQAQGRIEPRESRGPWRGLRQPGAPRCATSGCSVCRSRSPSTASVRYRCRDRRC